MAKRGQNEGSIYKRKDGRWVAVVNIGYKHGKRSRKSFYGRTRKEVQGKLTTALAAQQQALPLPPEKQTVGGFLAYWLEESVKPSLRPKTYHSYAQLVRLHLDPALGRIRLTKLDPRHVQSFLNEKLEAGLSPRTVQYLHAILRRALGQALKWGLVARNVATLVDAPSVVRAEIQPFTPDEARMLLNTVKGNPLEALYSVALAVGLRQGEALGLDWSDLDLDGRTLRVRTSLQVISGEFVFQEPKTKKSRRTITLPECAVSALRLHRARQIQDRLKAGKRWQEHGLVFTTSIGTPIHPRNLVRHYHRVLREANLPKKRFHDLRHTCASLLLAQGVQPRVVMEVLGHSQISLTMDTYSHVLPHVKDDAARQIDAILKEPSKNNF